MSGFAAHRPLPAQVEEGLCQLMALLWLEAQQGSYKDAYEERLAAYLGNQIRTDQVGGEGFCGCSCIMLFVRQRVMPG